MEIIKKNITLVLGISIPIAMILFVAGSVYLPGLFVTPHFNFLYVSCDDYYYRTQLYSIQGKKLVKNEIKQPEDQGYYQPPCESKLYIHDVAINESRGISFEDAQGLDVDSNLQSHDGFTIVDGSSGGGFFPFFFPSGGDYGSRYLKGHNLSKRLNIQLNGSSYYGDFRFLGWIQ